jgi:starch synthase
MRILVAASEVVGFAKTGGLADVAGSLPAALARRGHDCAVILPLYNSARSAEPPPEPSQHTFSVPVGPRAVSGALWRSTLPGSDVPVFLVGQDEYFGRDDPVCGRGPYQEDGPDGRPRDYPDNCERFAFFNRAVLEALRLLDFWPDLIHVNDWQTAPVPVYLREEYRRRATLSQPYDRVRTLLTIHNVAFQGVFEPREMKTLGLDRRLFNYRQLEFYGTLNLLKGGIVFADRVNTVSPTYAREIQTPYFGGGLHGVLYERRDRLSGVVNGVDYSVWDPAHDPHLPANYSPDALAPGKPRCKEALQRELGLRVGPSAPLLGLVARLTEQKGLDLVCAAAPALLGEGCQLAVLGTGEKRYEEGLARLAERFAGRVSLTTRFSERLAHRIKAGSDLLLMPSLFEPCGLSQLYGLRYGTPPVVRATGGLADTVVDATESALAAGTATGFRFQAYTPDAFAGAVRRAVGLFRGRPESWRRLMRAGMRQDWSWDRSAAEYERIYQSLVRGQ